jgi:aspartate/methionine/tyrosine aminotransferase
VSERSRQISEAISIKFNELVYKKKLTGIDVITLSLGEAFFDLPPVSFDEIDMERGFHYTDSRGLPELRRKIAGYYNSAYSGSLCHNDNILISAGSKILVFMTMMTVLDPGDEVLAFEPAWLSYEHQATLAGAKIKFVPIGFGLNDVDAFLSEKVKLVILNSPNNPAGTVYSSEEILSLVETCRDRNITVLIDEAYSDFVASDGFISGVSIQPKLDNIIVVNSLSKSMGLSGWRIGFVIANKNIINQMLTLNQHLVTCAPTVLQLYLAKNFDAIRAVTVPQAQSIELKRKKVLERLDQANIRYAKGSSTFYIFVNLSDYFEDTYDLAEHLLNDHNIAVVPGSAYGESTKGYLRMSIGVEPIDRIQLAIDTIKNILVSNERFF